MKEEGMEKEAETEKLMFTRLCSTMQLGDTAGGLPVAIAVSSLHT